MLRNSCKLQGAIQTQQAANEDYTDLQHATPFKELNTAFEEARKQVEDVEKLFLKVLTSNDSGRKSNRKSRVY